MHVYPFCSSPTQFFGQNQREGKEAPAHLGFFLQIEGRVEGIEIFRIQVVLDHAEGFAETLEMDDFALTEEADGIGDVGIVGKAQDVVVDDARLLFGGQVLGDVGDGVALDLKRRRGEGRAPRRRWGRRPRCGPRSSRQSRPS